MIEQLLPAAVASDELFHDPPEAELLPEERAALGAVGRARQEEFTSVRHAARRALSALGLPPAPLVPGLRGAPSWPEAVVGSMTHCVGYRAAAVGLSSRVRTVGIDAEPHVALPFGVLDRIALPEERGQVAELAHLVPGVSWDRLLFSAKETVYKAWFPLTRTWLGFHDASITFDAAGGGFHARVLPTTGAPVGAPDCFKGRWLATRSLLITAIAVLEGD
jgi:4'-phosphopantetheinyl transferase EntD